MVTGEGLRVKGRLDKQKLVPFGEVMPWPFSIVLEAMVKMEVALIPGSRVDPVVVTIGTSSVAVAATICFDAEFPGPRHILFCRSN